jgi:hypothetical protein
MVLNIFRFSRRKSVAADLCWNNGSDLFQQRPVSLVVTTAAAAPVLDSLKATLS